MPSQSQALQQRLDYLGQSHNVHLELLQQTVEADHGNLFAVDMLVIGAAQRSLALVEGFRVLMEHGNLLAAAPLLRMQIDSCMRLKASSLVDDPGTVLICLLEGKSLRKLKSRDGMNLTDQYLREELSKEFPWIAKVYEATSGFVHFSSPHLLSTFRTGPDRSAEISVGVIRDFPEASLLEAADAFIEATRMLLRICGSWLGAKEQVAERRKERSE